MNVQSKVEPFTIHIATYSKCKYEYWAQFHKELRLILSSICKRLFALAMKLKIDRNCLWNTP